MSGPKRNADSINTIGIVVVGICGAVMVYVSIAALQAFYMNDTSELQTMQDYGGQDTVAKSHKAEEMRNINEPALGTSSITIDRAMTLVVKSADEARAAGKPATLLVPGGCEANMPTEIAQPGHPVLDATRIGGCKGGIAPPLKVQPAGSGSGAGSGSASDAGAGSGSGSGSVSPAAGNGSASVPAAGKTGKPGKGSAATGANIPLHSTGTGGAGDTHAVGGTSGAPVGNSDNNAGSPAKLAPGGHAP